MAVVAEVEEAGMGDEPARYWAVPNRLRQDAAVAYGELVGARERERAEADWEAGAPDRQRRQAMLRALAETWDGRLSTTASGRTSTG